MTGDNNTIRKAIDTLKEKVSELLNVKGENNNEDAQEILDQITRIEKHLSQNNLNQADDHFPAHSESFMQAFYRAGLMMTVSTIDEGEYIEVNDFFCESSEYSREELVGKTSVELDFITADDRRQLAEELKSKGSVQDMRLRLKSKSGKEIISLYNGEIIDFKGKPALLSVAQNITPLIEAEEKLKIEKSKTKESEERFQRLSSLTFEGIVIHNKGICVDCNAAFEKMTNLSRDELIGKNLVEIFFDRDYHSELFKQMGKDYAEPYEVTIQKNDGTVIPIEIEAKDINWKGEQLRVAAIRDISKRYEAKEALQQSEERYKELLENSPVGIYRTNSKGEAIFYNKKMVEILGYKNVDEVKEKFKDLSAELYVNPERRKQFIQEMVSKGFVEDFEYEAKTNSGKHIWISMDARVSRTFADGTFYIDGFASDITKSKEAEEALKESEARYQTFIEQASEGIYRMEMKEPIDISLPVEQQIELLYDNAYMVECNNTMAALYGIDSVEAFIGKTMEELHGGRYNPINRKLNKNFIEGGYKITNEETHEYKIDGTEIYFSNNSTGIIEEGKLTRIWGTQFDITEKKRAEQALEQRVLALTQPLDDSKGITFDDLFDINEIQRIQDEFADATGVASLITHPDGTPITKHSNFRRLCKDIVRQTEMGRINCFKSDAYVGRLNEEGPNVHLCLGSGLWDAGASISVGGRHIANWLIGQVRDDSIKEEDMISYADEIGADRDEFIKAFREVPFMPKEQFEKVAQALFSLSKQLSLTAYQNVQQARFIAERKKAEKELIAERNRAQNILDGTSAGTWELNLATGETVINDIAAEKLGYTLEELSPVTIDTWRQHAHPEDQKKAEKILNDHIAGKRDAYEVEMRMRHKRGYWIWILSRGKIVEWNENGEPTLVSGTQLYITARKEAELGLLKLTNRFRLAADAAEIGVWEHDIAKDILIWDQWMYRLYGLETDSFSPSNKALEKYIHPDDLSRIRDEVNSLFRSEKSFDTQFRIIRPDGKVRYLKAFAMLERDSQGNPVRMTGINYDITQRIETEEALRSARDLLETAVAQSPSGIIIADAPDVKIRLTNTAALGIRGGKPDILTGIDLEKHSKNWQTYYPDGTPYPPEKLPLSRAVLKGETTENEEVIIRDEEGNEHYVLTNGAPIYDSQGNVTAGIVIFHEITERKLAEEALEESRDFFEQLYLQSATSTMLLDPEGFCLRVNPSFCELFGVNSKDFVNRNYNIFDDKECKRAGILDHIRNVLKTKIPETWEVQFDIDEASEGLDIPSTKSGKRWYYDTCYPILDAKGNVQYIVMQHEDVTEQKEAEEELAQSKRFFEQLYYQSATSTQLLNREGWCVRINPKLSKLFGVKPEDIEGRKYNIFQDAEMKKSGALDSVRKVFENKETVNWDVEFNIDNASDSTGVKVTRHKKVWFYNTAYPILDVKGNLEFVVIQHEDITERKQAEQALREGEERFRSYIENAPYGIFVADEDGNYIDVNEAAVAITGYSKAELLTMSVSSLIPEDLQSKAKQSHKSLVVTGSMIAELPFLHKKGKIRYWKVKGVKLSEKIYLGFAEDITERKQMEKDLLAAKNRAEEADTLKTNLLLNMSHEVRTPINGIMGLSTLLADLTKDRKQIDLINKLKLSSRRLLKTFTTVIDYSQVSAIIDRNDKDSINILKVLETVVKEYTPLAESKNITLRLRSESGHACTIATEDALNQIFSHLIDNAVKFTKDGEVVISVAQFDDMCSVSIEDTGIGIDEKDFDKIFREYRQVSEGMGRAFEGIGLGLTIVKQCVEQLGGTITVESELDKGTVFTVALPSIAHKKVTEDEAADTKDTEHILPEGKPRVLIVEDNDINCEIMEMFIEDFCEPHSAIDAEQALALIKNDNYSAVLMDINLGSGMNGIELAKEIRKIPHYKDIPIIAITGYVFRKDQKRFADEGFNGFIGKPFEEDELVEMVKRILNLS